MKKTQNTFELPLPPVSGASVCTVSFSARAKVMRIRISPDGRVSMVIPFMTGDDDAIRFLTEQIPWIRRTLLKIRRRTAADASLWKDPSFPQSVPLLFTGEIFRTAYFWQDRCWTAARMIRPDNILEFTGSVLDRQSVDEAFSRLIRHTAEQLFPPMLQSLADRMELSFHTCSVRMQSRRWGSCSRRRDISLNGKLMFFSPDLVEYVMVHELCHLKQMNHSAAFWREVTQVLPDWQERRKRLNQEAEKLPEAWMRLS